MSLPQQLSLQSMQTQWAQQLNPVVANPSNNPVVLQNVKLSAGNNVINHKLGRVPIGCNVCFQNAAATFYYPQSFTSLQLTINASADVTVNLQVF